MHVTLQTVTNTTQVDATDPDHLQTLSSSALRKLLQSLSQNSLSGAVASSCLLTTSANDTCRVEKQGKIEVSVSASGFKSEVNSPCTVSFVRASSNGVRSIKHGTHGDGPGGDQAVDEAEEDVLGVLRVALDAQHVLADAEHLDARLVGGGQHLRALRHLPHLLAMSKNAIRLQRCACQIAEMYVGMPALYCAHLVLVDLGDLGAARQLAAPAQRVEEPTRRQRVRDVHLPDADVPAAAGPAHAPAQRAADHLVAEADAEDPLAHGVQLPDQEAQAQDPRLVAVRVVRAAADHEAVVAPEVPRRREFPVDGPVQVPRLAGAAERGHEDVEVAAVLLEHVLRVARRHQQREPPARPRRCLHSNHGGSVDQSFDDEKDAM
jgi:hypothetical protein